MTASAEPASASARDRILDAFAHLLTEQGERAATLDAVAAAATVSKGGLLYHFASKEALVDGLLQRLDQAVSDDLERMLAAPEGVVDYFVRGSVATGSTLDTAIIAVVRLAQGQNEDALDTLHRAQEEWSRRVRDAVGDETVARLVLLVSDGLYFNSALWPQANADMGYDSDIDDLLEAIETLRRSRAGDP